MEQEGGLIRTCAALFAAYMTWAFGYIAADGVIWFFHDILGRRPTSGLASGLRFLAYFVAFFVLLNGTDSALRRVFEGGRRSGGGFSTNRLVRRFIGMTANTLVYGAAFVLAFVAGSVVAGFARRAGAEYPVPTLIVFCVVIVVMRWLPARLKFALGRGTRPLRRLWRSRYTGMGGSARFAGLLEEWSHPWRPGQILLGTSIYDPGWRIGIRDDRHFITIATNRSGKGRSAIIPNLLTWPGSALVIDPKGQNAAVTAGKRGDGAGGRVRRPMRQAVHVVDPFAVLAGVEGIAARRFNPLAELDLNDREIVEQIGLVADALVIPGKGGDAFWDISARSLLGGLVAYVLSKPEDQRNLGTVRDLLTDPKGLPLKEMAQSNAGGGLAKRAAAMLREAGDRTAGNIVATAMSNTAWLDSLAMRDCLAASDFTLRILKERPSTVYLVLPPEYLQEHGRFLRLFVNLSLRAAGRGAKSRHGILFLLDEFYSLGPLPLVEKAAGLLAGYGVKLWPIVQNLTQLRDLYPENWETFLGNAGQWQVFASNDATTARYVSERLGNHVLWARMRDSYSGTAEWVPTGVSPLRDIQELGRETSRDSGSQVVFVEGGDAFLLRRIAYDRAFSRRDYQPDPMEAGSQPRHAGGLFGRLAGAWRG